MKNKFRLYSCLWAAGVLLLAACGREPDLEEARRQILDLHQKLIAAHREGKPDFPVSGWSGEYFSIKDGDILRPDPAEMKAGLETYLRETTFTEYRDLREPLIGFSKDGTLAWSAVRVKARGTRRKADGTSREVDFVCAWLTMYEKTDSGWKVLSEVSTFQ